MEIYHCLKCKDKFAAERIPERCPLCGAPDCYLVDSVDWLKLQIQATRHPEPEARA